MTIKPECIPLIIVNSESKIAIFHPTNAQLSKKSKKLKPHDDKLKKQEFVIL